MAQERFIGPHEMPDVLAQWRHYVRLLDPGASQAVLDIGCHEGDAIALLVGDVPEIGRVVGLDRNEHKCKVATERFAEHRAVEIVRGDATKLPFEDASFDRVYCADTLEWTADPSLAISEMRRVLRPGGRALVIHSDFDTQVFASANLELTRRLVHAFADRGPRGALGRDLFGLCSAAGFARVDPSVFVLVGTSLAANRYPAKILAMMRTWLIDDATIDAATFDAWERDLVERERSQAFFYSINRNLCLCWA